VSLSTLHATALGVVPSGWLCPRGWRCFPPGLEESLCIQRSAFEQQSAQLTSQRKSWARVVSGDYLRLNPMDDLVVADVMSFAVMEGDACL
jgi:hypothetical protein